MSRSADVHICQEKRESSQVTDCFGVVYPAPVESVICHCHQIITPGGIEPVFFISQTSDVLISVPALNCGCTRVTSLVRDRLLLPYERTMFFTGACEEPARENVILLGKSWVARLVETVTLAIPGVMIGVGLGAGEGVGNVGEGAAVTTGAGAVVIATVGLVGTGEGLGTAVGVEGGGEAVAVATVGEALGATDGAGGVTDGVGGVEQPAAPARRATARSQ